MGTSFWGYLVYTGAIAAAARAFMPFKYMHSVLLCIPPEITSPVHIINIARPRPVSFKLPPGIGWLGSRVVSVLDSGAEGPGFKLQPLSGNSLRQTVHIHCASVHQAAILAAALLRVAGVTAGMAESNGSLLLGL